MGFCSRIQGIFAEDVQSRGLSYVSPTRLRVIEASPARVRAEVQGSSPYKVQLNWDGKHLCLSCSCPYSASYEEPCKHLWAAVLVAERRGYLEAVPPEGPLQVLLAVGDGAAGKPDEEPDESAEEFNDVLGMLSDDTELRELIKSLGQLGRTSGRRPRRSGWGERLEALADLGRRRHEERTRPDVNETQLKYIIDLSETRKRAALYLEIWVQKRRRGREWSAARPFRLEPYSVENLTEVVDRRIARLVLGGARQSGWDWEEQHFRHRLAHAFEDILLPLLGSTNRLQLRRKEGDEPQPVAIDSGPPWELRARLEKDQDGKGWLLNGFLIRGEEVMELSSPELLLESGYLFARGKLARLEHQGAFEWLSSFREHGPIRAPAKQGDEFFDRVFGCLGMPSVELPVELGLQEVTTPPRPRLMVRAAVPAAGDRGRLPVHATFLYGDLEVHAHDPRPRIFQLAKRILILRDTAFEAAALARLAELGFRAPKPWRYPYAGEEAPLLTLAPRQLPKAVPVLVQEGWSVEAEGKIYRRPGRATMSVSSGIDWFDLVGSVEFDGKEVPLPAVLAALRKGDSTIVLGDGTLGLLPEEWLKKYGLLASLGSTEGPAIRYRRSQVGLLEALLRQHEEVTRDAGFERAREELSEFEGISPAAAPPDFRGTLRPYQSDGLGWLGFLRKFGFGGCLADDMGLGKTVQVLAYLEARRAARGGESDEPGNGRRGRRASLVVVPRSLIFNWRSEAARFTPHLRVLDHTGILRPRDPSVLAEHDVVLTTYGTLLRDVEWLKDIDFDCVILDESQAIKNPASESAKAVRLLSGEQRLALSGTPIENHLGELWSLFEFLNPGMLGSGAFAKWCAASGRQLDDEARAALARALRPFILRRTKGQVAKELPERSEQTILCDLDPEERKLYEELRLHYRRELLNGSAGEAMGAEKIRILEALLRLRQAACHPGLIDCARAGATSTKVGLLLDHLEDVQAEGHKALVFSQFTTLLGIVRRFLDQRGIAYEYLDGRTRDRQARVSKFQEDPDCRIFLISLKAGGLGLNLTAAEYVFLLDPWWNPAVEAQAIDRAHRIGQTRHVMAYRLIARDTVEEKVLELQRNKRELADALINAGNSLIRDLTKEDLEALLS